MYFNYRSISALAVLAALGLLTRHADAAPAATSAAADSYEHIYKENVFDPKRAQWAVATPVPSIPPPSANDIQLYGIVNIGTVKRAVFKVAPLLAGVGKRQFLTLSEGQSIGSYQVAEIKADQVVLAAGDARYPLRFATKADRSPAGVPASAPTQAPMELPPAMPTMVPGFTPVVPAQQPVVASAPSAAAVPPQPSATPPAEGQQAQTKTADAAQPAPQAAAPIQGATLLEAIEAARRAQAAGQPSYPNPFTK